MALEDASASLLYKPLPSTLAPPLPSLFFLPSSPPASLPAITGWRLLLKQQQSPTYTTFLQRIFLGGGRNHTARLKTSWNKSTVSLFSHNRQWESKKISTVQMEHSRETFKGNTSLCWPEMLPMPYVSVCISSSSFWFKKKKKPYPQRLHTQRMTTPYNEDFRRKLLPGSVMTVYWHGRELPCHFIISSLTDFFWTEQMINMERVDVRRNGRTFHSVSELWHL